MKVIIDISDEAYSECQGNVYFPDTGGKLFDSIKNGIPLPDNATNGDIIKKLFSNIEIEVIEDITDVYNIGNHRVTFDTEWWNEPYKEQANDKQ